jgi:hypothetical protein
MAERFPRAAQRFPCASKCFPDGAEHLFPEGSTQLANNNSSSLVLRFGDAISGL